MVVVTSLDISGTTFRDGGIHDILFTVIFDPPPPKKKSPGRLIQQRNVHFVVFLGIRTKELSTLQLQCCCSIFITLFNIDGGGAIPNMVLPTSGISCLNSGYFLISSL